MREGTRQSHQVRRDPWFLLYGGTSIDGTGPGVYIGRTTNRDEAREHFQKCAADPYSVGYVLIVTDTDTRRAFRVAELEALGGAGAETAVPEVVREAVAFRARECEWWANRSGSPDSFAREAADLRAWLRATAGAEGGRDA